MSTFDHQSRIKKLSPLLINQLSAGEVVTRPASVVKELLENAIDAGATQITINITQGGMGLIEISDNGSGIHPDDMLMAVTRHATSKVADVQHLHGIRTLGFRGEALASISAVSRFTITSSPDDSGVGRCLTVAGQIDNPDVSPVVCQRGTTVSVRDLYFNVPARRGNLKSIATEYAHIEAVIRHVALVYANIELNLFNEGKRRLSLPVVVPNSSVQHIQYHASFDDMSGFTSEKKPSIVPVERLKQALATQLPNTAHELFVDLSGLSNSPENSANIPYAHIQGWLWLKDTLSDSLSASLDKPADLPKLIYINARLVKDTAISQQIRQAIQAVDLTIHDVGYALFFTLPHHWLNLNVHPSKQRVNIHALTNINAHLHHELRKLLQSIVSDKSLISATDKQTNQDFSTADKDKQDSLAIDSNENVNYVFSHSNTGQVARQIAKQVASLQAIYQVAKTNVHPAKDSQYDNEHNDNYDNNDNDKYHNDRQKTAPEGSFDAILNASLALITDKNFEPLLLNVLSNPPNQWQPLQQAMSNYQRDNAQNTVEYDSYNFIPCTSVMWTELPTQQTTYQAHDHAHQNLEKIKPQNWVLLILIHQQSLATKSVLYHRKNLPQNSPQNLQHNLEKGLEKVPEQGLESLEKRPIPIPAGESDTQSTQACQSLDKESK